MSKASLNFAPYQSPPSSPRGSKARLAGPSTLTASKSSSDGAARPKSPWFSVGSYQSGARPSDLAASNGNGIGSSTYHSGAGSRSGTDVLHDAEQGNAGFSGTSGAVSADLFETSYGWRVDIEAAAAYILGPALAILLLMVEIKNDYVRFHAWQSLLLGAASGILHILLLWSSFFSWLLFIVDMGLYGFLAYRAFLDGNSSTLDRYHLPRLGELANQWTENE